MMYMLPDPVVRPTAAVSRRPRILLLTEGTYPHVLGGVSSWCQLLLDGTPDLEWQVLPVVAGNRRPDPVFELPPNARLLPAIELWSTQPPARGVRPTGGDGSEDRLPTKLLVGLLGWETDPASTVDALVWCRRHSRSIRRIFRSRRAWVSYLETLADLVGGETADVRASLDHLDAADLYQTLYWVARAAATPVPDCDVLHVTAAGWCALPAIVHRALTGTPLLLTEHGLYMREAYLAAIIEEAVAGERFLRTRLARGLTLLTYASSDVVAPVSRSNAEWEIGNGVAPDRIRVIPNGVVVDGPVVDPPRSQRVVAVGRIDPLKDVFTMLRVAHETIRRRPDVTFVHYGPVSPGQASYGRACLLLHERLGLGHRFRFMGPTRDPAGAVRSGDVALLTSISEGMPLALLEAMAQARPIVSTAVGGVAEIVRGCGLLAPPGHADGLANSICTLIDEPELAQALGRRGRARVIRSFSQARSLALYSTLLHELVQATPRAFLGEFQPDVEGVA